MAHPARPTTGALVTERRDGAPHVSASGVRGIAGALGAGRPVIVTSETVDSGFGALVCFAAETFDTAAAAFLIAHTCGFVTVTVPGEVMARLNLPMMYPRFDTDSGRFCVAIDAAEGVTTGISAADRAHTIGLVAAPATGAEHLVRPGHVVPVAVGGAFCAARWSVYDALWSLSIQAGLSGVVAAAALVNGAEEADYGFVSQFSTYLGLPIVSSAQVG
jgi:3,4-dihydroxy-2-butanone 4-phosphate synthase